MLKIFLYFYLLVLASCSTPPKEYAESQAYAPANLNALTNEVLLMADTQEHEEAGAPWLLAPKADPIAEVTIRPVQQTLFAKTLLKEQVLQAETAKKLPVIHLGDLLDVSCPSEWYRVRTIFETANTNEIPWVIMPGNHDGFYMGLASPKDGSNLTDVIGVNGWDTRCRRGNYEDGHPLSYSKGRKPANDDPNISKYPYIKYKEGDGDLLGFNKAWYVASYLDLLTDVDSNKGLFNLRGVLPGILNNFSSELQSRNFMRDAKIWHNSKKDEFIQSVAWSIVLDSKTPSKGAAWESYLLQKVLLPPASKRAGRVIAILLDSSNYESANEALPSGAGAPGMWQFYRHNAGVEGEVGDEQLNIAAEWLKTEREEQPTVQYVLMSHHPWASLKETTQKKIEKTLFASFGRPLLYVSAHTHTAAWFPHTTSSGSFSELNIGSLTDSPIHTRKLAVYKSISNESTYAAYSPLYEIKTSDRSCMKNGENYLGELTPQTQSEQLSVSFWNSALEVPLQFNKIYQSTYEKAANANKNSKKKQSALTNCNKDTGLDYCKHNLIGLKHFNILASLQLRAYAALYERFPNIISEIYPIKVSLNKTDEYVTSDDKKCIPDTSECHLKFGTTAEGNRVFTSYAQFLHEPKPPQKDNLYTMLKYLSKKPENDDCQKENDEMIRTKCSLGNLLENYSSSTRYIDAIERHLQVIQSKTEVEGANVVEVANYQICQALSASEAEYVRQKRVNSSGAAFKTIEDGANHWRSEWLMINSESGRAK